MMTRRRLEGWCGWLFCAVLFFSNDVMAQDEPEAEEPAEDELTGEMSADLAFATNYVWRGQVLNTEPVLQPSVTASSWGFFFNTWANFDLTERNPAGSVDGGVKGEFSEVDLTLGYEQEFGIISVSLAFVEYLFPNTGSLGSREVILTTAVDFIVSPTLTLAYDYGVVDGLYSALGAGWGMDVLEMLGFGVDVSVGFADSGYSEAYFGTDAFALQDLTATLHVDVSVIGPFSVSTGGTFAMLLDSDIAETRGDNDMAFGGWLNLSYAP